MSAYYGKYRGIVIQNVDPMQTGRVQVSVPAVLGAATQPWAMPCAPIAGLSAGVYVVPTVGSNVWVEFEGGDTDRPIWSGGFWTQGTVPAQALIGVPASPSIVLNSALQSVLSISDGADGIMIRHRSGAMILINDAGITLSNGKGATIVMAGASVAINAPALVVT
ncbi:MAG: phage baseplate assembly protein V [Candidatus Promineifilaceae bacterium]